VRYSFNPDGTYSTHNVAENGRFHEADEEVRDGMTGLERQHILELRRLRRRREYITPFWELRTAEGAMIEGENIVFGKKALIFKMAQTGTVTESFIARTLAIQTKARTDDDISQIQYENIVRDQQPAVVQAIRDEITVFLERIRPVHGTSFTGLKLPEPRVMVVQDARGLNVSVQKKTHLSKGFPSSRTGIQQAVNVTMSRTTIMEECFPSVAKRVEEHSENTTIRGITRQEREKAVTMAREEIQGVMNTMQLVMNEPMDIEPATTGLLERTIQLECEYCEKRHRNGDCALPFGPGTGDIEDVTDLLDEGLDVWPDDSEGLLEGWF
jgi:hypothetical protein